MPLIQNMIGVLLKICIFFKYSAKRHGLLEENITHICVESSKKKLVKVKRDGLPDALRVVLFIELYQAIGSNLLEFFLDI